jgi:hypothetical protein
VGATIKGSHLSDRATIFITNLRIPLTERGGGGAVTGLLCSTEGVEKDDKKVISKNVPNFPVGCGYMRHHVIRDHAWHSPLKGKTYPNKKSNFRTSIATLCLEGNGGHFIRESASDFNHAKVDRDLYGRGWGMLHSHHGTRLKRKQRKANIYNVFMKLSRKCNTKIMSQSLE